MFSDKQGLVNVKLKKNTLVNLLRSLFLHLTPLLRTQFLEQGDLTWRDLLQGSLKGQTHQYRSLRPAVRPKRAFNWFRERPYLFLNQRPTFESKLD